MHQWNQIQRFVFDLRLGTGVPVSFGRFTEVSFLVIWTGLRGLRITLEFYVGKELWMDLKSQGQFLLKRGTTLPKCSYSPLLASFAVCWVLPSIISMAASAGVAAVCCFYLFLNGTAMKRKRHHSSRWRKRRVGPTGWKRFFEVRATVKCQCILCM